MTKHRRPEREPFSLLTPDELSAIRLDEIEPPPKAKGSNGRHASDDYLDDKHCFLEDEEKPKQNGRGPPLLAAIDLVTLEDVEPRAVEWLWPGRLARRKLTLIAGEPDLGKSQIALDAVARIARGRSWPDEGSDSAPLGSCIILSAEDAVDDVLRPRLEAAGADLSRVHAVRSVLARGQDGNQHPTVFSLQRDLDQLGEKITGIGDVSLILIDPITAYFGDQVDTHKTAAVRAVLAQVDSFADRYDVAVLGITHPPKTVPGARAINSITGSLAFVAAARMAFLVVPDAADNDRRLLLGIKNNLGSKAPGLAYRISTKIVTGNIVAPYLTWDSTPMHMTANEALAAVNEAAKERGDALREAKQFLRDLLEVGPVAADEGAAKAKAEGIKEKTLNRARKVLGVKATKEGFQGRWMWVLPGHDGA